MTRHIAITSGKGGVGKTSVSVNLAYQLVRMGFKTCLFDADLGLANVNILLGLSPRLNLKDIILNDNKIQDVLIRHPDGIDILPGSSGIEKMVDLDLHQVQKLINSFQNLEAHDFLLFDTSAGIAREVIAFCLASPEVLVVLTPEPTSLTDAYALVKVLTQNGYRGDIKVLVNRCKSTAHAKLVYNKFKSAAAKFLGIRIGILGVIMEDVNVSDAVANQKPFMGLYPQTVASKCIAKIAKRLVDQESERFTETSTRSFWERCLHALGGALHAGHKTPDMELENEKTADNRQPAPRVKTVEDVPRDEVIEAAVKEENSDPPGNPEAERIAGEKQSEPISGIVSAPEEISQNSIGSAWPDLLAAAARNLSVVSNELQLIRKSMERLENLPDHREGRTPAGNGNAKPAPVQLDFKAFLEKHRAE